MNNSENIVTLYGRVGTKIELREGSSVPWAAFRVGSTPRFFDGGTRTWQDRDTSWMTIKVFRALAQNVAESLEVGDPVVVIGSVHTKLWTTKEGEPRQEQVVHAHLVSHDLNRGVTRYSRVERPASVDTSSQEEAEVMERLAQQTPPATAA